MLARRSEVRVQSHLGFYDLWKRHQEVSQASLVPNRTCLSPKFAKKTEASNILKLKTRSGMIFFKNIDGFTIWKQVVAVTLTLGLFISFDLPPTRSGFPSCLIP